MSSKLLWLFFVVAVLGCQSQPVVQKPAAEAPVKKPTHGLSFVPRGLDLSQAPDKIVFGSCFDQDLEASIWDTIALARPDLIIAMGDNVYASKPHKRPFADQYKKLERLDDYRKLRETVPFLATWDDNDFGQNDGGADNPDKEESRKSFSFHYPYIKDSTLLDQPGLFHSKILGGVKEGRGRRARTNKSLHVIVLDTRWNKSAWTYQDSADGTYKIIVDNPDPKMTILGETQWEWLEDQLREPADFKILVSSMQVLAEKHGYERWGHFPKEKQKLLDLIVKTKPKNLVILSGDRHFASVSKVDLPSFGPLYEITSSPLNTPKGAINEEEAVYQFPIYVKENFGTAEFNWPENKVTFKILDAKSDVVQSLDLKIKK